MPHSTANYLTIDALGNVGALFSGGVTLLESDAANPPATRALKWTRGQGGPTVSQDYVFGNARFITSVPVAAAGSSVQVGALNGGVGAASIFAIATNAAAIVQAAAGARSTNILDKDGRSDYLQLGLGNFQKYLHDMTFATASFNVPAGTVFGPVFLPFPVASAPSYVRIVGWAIRDFGNASAVTVSFTFPGGGLNCFGKNNGGAACGFQLDLSLILDVKS